MRTANPGPGLELSPNISSRSVLPAGLVTNPAGRLVSRADRWLLDKTIAGCRADKVPEVRSLGRTLAAWRTEILAHHSTGASNGPTEGLNLLVKKVSAADTVLEASRTTRLRVLLHTGGIKWQTCTAARLRTRSPHLDA